MTHDPMCEWAECICPRGYDDERGHLVHCPDQDCECEFIAKVRADERKQAGQRVISLPNGASLSVAAAVASGNVDAGVGW
jgi:hypothetical protein